MENKGIEKAVELGKSAELVVFAAEPFNAAAPVESLADSFITETPLFYVRNHGNIPALETSNYRLEVGGMVEETLKLNLAELQNRFKIHSITATMQCAGNRRDEMIEVREIPGEMPWQANAISCANWRGVRLADVLAAAGVKTGAMHVAFDGADEITKKVLINFGASIPLDKAMSEEVLLAFEMNGQPLLPVHGAPLRVVVPGYIGARSVKWLTTITVQEKPSDNHYQQEAYKIFPPHITKETVDWTKGLTLSEGQINSVICEPLDGAELEMGATIARGYAMSGGGRSIERIEVSPDGGHNWVAAKLLEPRENAEVESNKRSWVWQLWECSIELKLETRELIVRAYDSSANTQPETIAPLWNFKGYMNNGWHRIKLKVKK